MSPSAPTPPLLLTKRLTSFLRSNLSAQLHTALLTTLSGKLLAHASSQPVSTLRTQCTIAASIWAVYAAPAATAALSDALPAAGPSSSSSPAAASPDTTSSGAVTIQLTGAVLVVRKLKCGLLFVCIGPAPDGGDHPPGQSAPGPGHPAPPAAPHAASLQPTPLGSPSEAASVLSTGAATTTSATTTGTASAAGIVQIRRQTEELAKWLDDKLGSLGVPDEEAGNEGR